MHAWVQCCGHLSVRATGLLHKRGRAMTGMWFANGTWQNATSYARGGVNPPTHFMSHSVCPSIVVTGNLFRTAGQVFTTTAPQKAPDTAAAVVSTPSTPQVATSAVRVSAGGTHVPTVPTAAQRAASAKAEVVNFTPNLQ